MQNQINPQGSTNYSSIRPNAILQIEIPLPEIQVQQNFIKEYSNLKEKLLQIQKFNVDTIESLKSNMTTSLLFKDLKSIDLLREYIIEKNERINRSDSNLPKVWGK